MTGRSDKVLRHLTLFGTLSDLLGGSRLDECLSDRGSCKGSQGVVRLHILPRMLCLGFAPRGAWLPAASTPWIRDRDSCAAWSPKLKQKTNESGQADPFQKFVAAFFRHERARFMIFVIAWWIREGMRNWIASREGIRSSIIRTLLAVRVDLVAVTFSG